MPRTNRDLRPGDFWAIQLECGRYACGRVVQLPPPDGTGSRTLFLAGLMNWSGDTPPSAESIAGSTTLRQGQAHIVTIVRSGGEVLGNRPLELDGILPGLFVDSAGGPHVRLQRGLEAIGRPSAEQKRTVPVLSTWGYRVPRVIASRAFCGSR